MKLILQFTKCAIALFGVMLLASHPAMAEEKHRIVIQLDSKELTLSDAARAAADKAIGTIHAVFSSKALDQIAANVNVDEIRDSIRKAMAEAHRSGDIIFEPLWIDDVEKGNPYSAREVREFKQTLGDGTVISRQSTRLLARDRDGRTRQELRQPDGTARVFINDPVAKEAIILDPQKKLACRAEFVERAIYDCFSQTRGDWKPTGFAFAASRNGIGMLRSQEDINFSVASDARVIDLTKANTLRREVVKRQQGDSETAMPPLPPVPPAPPTSNQIGRGVSGEAQINRQKKTKQSYEGLLVDTDRTVEMIAAGAIGNSKAIESVYERFYSPQLKMNVYVRRSDPRNGESLYRMTDIKLSDPDANAFRVPTGHSISNGKK